jgi:hypothetical protein
VSPLRKRTLTRLYWEKLTRFSFWPFSLGIVILCLESCSGLDMSGGSVPGQGAFIVTLRANSPSAQAGVNVLSFRTKVLGISLTPATGGSVNVALNSDPYAVDLSRLQSDTALLAVSNSIPAGTYTNMVVSLVDPAVTYCTQTQGLTGCAADSVASVSGAPATPIISTAPFPLVIGSTQNGGTAVAINVNIEKALTVNGQTQAITAVDLGAPDVLTAMILPSASNSLPSSALDFVEDITGIVSAVDEATQKVTVQTATRGLIIAIANSATSVSPNCMTFNLGTTFSCVKQGQVASLDTILAPDGSLALIQYDPLGITEGDWIEGIVSLPPSSPTQFQVVINDFVLATNNSLVRNKLGLSDPVAVTLANVRPFQVDGKGLLVPSTPFLGATDASVLAPGQTLFLHVVSFTPSIGTSQAAANVDFVYLRFTRVTGDVSGSAPPNTFTMQSFPPFFGLTLPVTVQLSNGLSTTNFDGVPDASGLVSGQTASIRALYFGPPTGPTPTATPFSAAKVRLRSSD